MKTEDLLVIFNKDNLLEKTSNEYIIAFANYVSCLHVNKALLCASEKAYTTEERTVTLGGSRWETVVDRDSIINAYPLKKIC